jgi:hypothetical protein
MGMLLMMTAGFYYGDVLYQGNSVSLAGVTIRALFLILSTLQNMLFPPTLILSSTAIAVFILGGPKIVMGFKRQFLLFPILILVLPLTLWISYCCTLQDAHLLEKWHRDVTAIGAEIALVFIFAQISFVAVTKSWKDCRSLGVSILLLELSFIVSQALIALSVFDTLKLCL